MLSSRSTKKITKNDGNVTLIIKWTRNILKSLDLVKICGTTAKREMNPPLYKNLSFSWKRKIASVTFEHRNHNNMVLNFDQTPLGCKVENEATFTYKRSQFVPIANVNNKRQITGTLCVNISGGSLPIQMIYGNVTDRCHLSVKFSGSFRTTHSQNQLSNEGNTIEYFHNLFLPFLAKKRKYLNLLDNAKTLLIDVFRSQAANTVNEASSRNNHIFMRVPTSNKRLFQPLDFLVNKSTEYLLWKDIKIGTWRRCWKN